MSAVSRFAGVMVVSTLLGSAALAQEAPAKPPAKARFYRLDFVVKEVEDGKTINSRAYFAIMSSANGASPTAIRTGSRVPVATPPNSSNFQLYEVGVSIDCRSGLMLDVPQAEALESQGLLALNVTADITGLAPTEGMPNAQAAVTRNIRWASAVIVPVKKPTIIFSSDDVTSKRKVQLELTATPIQQ